MHIQKELQKDVETEVAKTQVHHQDRWLLCVGQPSGYPRHCLPDTTGLLRLQREYFLNEQLKKIKQELGHVSQEAISLSNLNPFLLSYVSIYW